MSSNGEGFYLNDEVPNDSTYSKWYGNTNERASLGTASPCQGTPLKHDYQSYERLRQAHEHNKDEEHITSKDDKASSDGDSVTSSLEHEKLGLLESPFTWQASNTSCAARTQGDLLKTLTEKRQKKDDADGQWQVLIVNLALSYENWKIHDIEKTHILVEECESMLYSGGLLGNHVDDFIVVNQDAIKYILQSTRYFMAADDRERQEILRTMTHVEELTDHVSAGIHGIRAGVYMEYGYTGTCEAIPHITTAIRLDPEAAEWHFLYGKAIGRRRHVENAHGCLTVEELISLETAVDLSNSQNPYFVIFLAQAYREAASNLRHERDNFVVQQQVKKMNDRAFQLYEIVLTLRPECPHINVRCAQGYMRFQESHRDYDRAYQCCQKAILATPDNIMVNHVWGQINDKLGNTKVALMALEKAATLGAFGAYMDWVRLKRRAISSYDPLSDLETMLKSYSDPPYQKTTLSQLGSHHYFVLDNVEQAVRCLLEIVRSEPLSEKLKVHYPITFKTKSPFNLYAVLIHELPIITEVGDQSDLATVMATCEEHFPELLEGDNSKLLNYVKSQAKYSKPRWSKPVTTRQQVVVSSRSDADSNWRRESLEKRRDAREERAARWGGKEERGGRDCWRSGGSGDRYASGEPVKYLSWRDKSAKVEDASRLGGGDCKQAPPFEIKMVNCKDGVYVPKGAVGRDGDGMVKSVVVVVSQVVKEVPQVAKEVPQVAKEVPQVAKEVPQVVKMEPQVVKVVPQVVKELPQVVKIVPQVAKKEPQMVQMVPQVVKVVPQVAKEVPQVAKVVPQVAKEVPQVVKVVPQLAKKVSQMKFEPRKNVNFFPTFAS